ncbi:MAG: DUF4256 domain-containing protein [Eubacteriales bacterium]|nr:DUF4256 domain-containing protein [Eubacteriales bacterium]MDD4105582.1 DUF4256 domain-containing protein [Eubacteriales bacterium]MDD4710842.1 DUF4256 domain-containing protein [Eubacteriales bacterium]
MTDKTNNEKQALTEQESRALLATLETRFKINMDRHPGIRWGDVQKRLLQSPEKLWSLNEMEKTGGEPDLVLLDENSKEYLFFDCSKESPLGRRNLCYDAAALASRKANKPAENAMSMAEKMSIEVLSEDVYRKLQQRVPLDLKSSSWIKTPENIRTLGGALFCDRRYDTVFVYHNGAESYYSARGFRAVLKV